MRSSRLGRTPRWGWVSFFPLTHCFPLQKIRDLQFSTFRTRLSQRFFLEIPSQLFRSSHLLRSIFLDLQKVPQRRDFWIQIIKLHYNFLATSVPMFDQKSADSNPAPNVSFFNLGIPPPCQKGHLRSFRCKPSRKNSSSFQVHSHPCTLLFGDLP